MGSGQLEHATSGVGAHAHSWGELPCSCLDDDEDQGNHNSNAHHSSYGDNDGIDVDWIALQSATSAFV